MKNLWNDEDGVILSAEIVLIGTVLVIGMMVGLVELQVAVVGELSDLGDAIGKPRPKLRRQRSCFLQEAPRC